MMAIFFCPTLYGQIDSSYIKPFDDDFSARTYILRKIAGFEKETKENGAGLNYKINAPVGIGVGVAWRSYSLSFSQRFSFLRDHAKGKTNSLYFDYNGFKRKYIYSISLQRHRGFYDSKRDLDGKYTLYPDMLLVMLGGNIQWVFNYKKFSYKASFNQNERQLKSAGSFQLGAVINYSRLTTDTTVIFNKPNESLKNLQFGITGGYAYTLVLGSRWFLTGSTDLGLNIGNNYPNEFFHKKLELYPTIISRAATGYNMRTWSFGFSMHYKKIFFLFDNDNKMSMDEFNLQINVIKRFSWGNKFVNKSLQKTQDTLNKFGL